jgi:putative ABC transport system permease protein
MLARIAKAEILLIVVAYEGESFVAVLAHVQTAARAQGRLRAYTSLSVTAREAFWIAIEELRSHKLRSFLTLLGVVIATTTLIVVMSVVNGMNLYIATKIANLGTNTFVLHQFKWAQGYEEFLKALRQNKPIRLDDYEFLRDNLADYQAISALAQLQFGPMARYGSHVIDEVTLIGITPSHADIGREKVEYGRYLTEQDYNHHTLVCFIGQDIVEKLFLGIDPLDKQLLVGGQSFRIVGVADKVGSTLGVSQDNFVFIPLSTFGMSTWRVRSSWSLSKRPTAST